MSYLVIAGLALMVVMVAGCVFVANNTDYEITFSVISIISGITAIIIWVVVATVGYAWVASATKAKIINNAYGTTYTREEVFYGRDVIDEIREVERKRIEVNGDLLQRGGE